MRDRRTTEFVLNVFLKAKPDVAYSPTEVYHMGGFLVNKKAPTFIVNRLPKLMESIGWRRIKVGMRGRYIYHGKEFKPSTVAQRNRRAPSNPRAARRLDQTQEIARQVIEGCKDASNYS